MVNNNKKIKNKKPKVAPAKLKILQGGTTGLVQQNLKNYPPARPKGMRMIEYIHETMTESYKMDIVLIQWGYKIRAIKNCAEYFAKLSESKPFVVTSGYKCWNIFNIEFIERVEQKKIKFLPTKEIIKSNEDQIIDDNDNFVVLNKASGISVQGGTKSKKNLVDIFAKSEIFEGTKPYSVHRLDKDTSGVFIMAKNRESAQLLTYLLAYILT